MKKFKNLALNLGDSDADDVEKTEPKELRRQSMLALNMIEQNKLAIGLDEIGFSPSKIKDNDEYIQRFSSNKPKSRALNIGIPGETVPRKL